MIKFENGKYIVYSEKGRIFGKYSSEKEAKKRIQQMKMFKHFKKTAQLRANLKNFFAQESSCKVLGKATKCVFGKAPKFYKKAEYVFKIINNI